MSASSGARWSLDSLRVDLSACALIVGRLRLITKGVGNLAVVKVLLNTLEAERYLRRPILEEMIDLFDPRFSSSIALGTLFLGSLSNHEAFRRGVDELRARVCAQEVSTA